MKRSVYSILKECSEVKNVKERVEKLQSLCTPVIQSLLKYAYDPDIKFLLPEGAPPYKPCEFVDQESRLHSEARLMYLFIEGGNPNLTKLKREMLFIQLLEGVHKDDANLLCHIKDKKLPFKTINNDIVKKAFPNLY
jgi:hypothetical protein